MILDHQTTRAHADHGAAWSAFVTDWWRTWTPALRRPRPPVRKRSRLA